MLGRRQCPPGAKLPRARLRLKLPRLSPGFRTTTNTGLSKVRRHVTAIVTARHNAVFQVLPVCGGGVLWKHHASTTRIKSNAGAVSYSAPSFHRVSRSSRQWTSRGASPRSVRPRASPHSAPQVRSHPAVTPLGSVRRLDERASGGGHQVRRSRAAAVQRFRL